MQNGWMQETQTCHPHLEKSFHFSSKEKMMNFIVELLQIQHEPKDLSIEATEIKDKLIVIVSLETNLNSDKWSVRTTIKDIENMFLENN